MLEALRQRGAACLLGIEDEHAHRYAYDWRSKTPVIYRTTPQATPTPRPTPSRTPSRTPSPNP